MKTYGVILERKFYLFDIEKRAWDLVCFPMKSTKTISLWLPHESSHGFLDFDSINRYFLFFDVEDLEWWCTLRFLTLDRTIDTDGKIFALILPCHFNGLNIVKIFDSDFVSSWYSDKSDSSWSFTLFRNPVWNAIVLWWPWETSNTSAFDWFFVQKTTVWHLVDTNSILRLSSKESWVMWPFQMRPFHLTTFIGNRDGEFTFFSLAQYIVDNHSRWRITTSTISGDNITFVWWKLQVVNLYIDIITRLNSGKIFYLRNRVWNGVIETRHPSILILEFQPNEE